MIRFDSLNRGGFANLYFPLSESSAGSRHDMPTQKEGKYGKVGVSELSVKFKTQVVFKLPKANTHLLT